MSISPDSTAGRLIAGLVTAIALAGGLALCAAKDRGNAGVTAYKLLMADVIDGKLTAVPRGVMAAGNVMEGSRGGGDVQKDDIPRVKSHLEKYYEKMDDAAQWGRD